MATIRISKITEADFKELISLFREFAAFEKVPEKMTNSVDQMIREKDFVNGFVAKDADGDIVGYATYFFAYYTWVGKSLYMDDLYIRKQYRGMGIGSVLIRKMIDFAREQNCNKIRWQVSDWNNPAINFYKSLGAQIDDVERNCDILL
ncbi:MAG: GNAT family N-acetyltransferase [Dysgonomonas sp.]